MHARNPRLEYRETRTGDFASGVEIKLSQTLADIDVIFHREIKLSRLAHTAHLHVVVCGFPCGHRGVRQIRNHHQKVVESFLHAVELLFQRFELLGLRADL